MALNLARVAGTVGGYAPRQLNPSEKQIQAIWDTEPDKVRDLVEKWIHDCIGQISATYQVNFDDNEFIEYLRIADEVVTDCRKREVSPFAAVQEIRACLTRLNLIRD
jgi:hypothetical protein